LRQKVSIDDAPLVTHLLFGFDGSARRCLRDATRKRLATGGQSWEGLGRRQAHSRESRSGDRVTLHLQDGSKEEAKTPSSDSSGDSDHQPPILRMKDTIQERDGVVATRLGKPFLMSSSTGVRERLYKDYEAL